MRIFQTVILILLIVLTIGCRTLGETRMSGSQVTVSIGQEVLNRPEKVEVIRENQGVEQLYDYVNYYFKDGNIRPSLKVDIAITQFRIGWGRDHMAIHVFVFENGQELKSFTKVETTGRGSQVKRLSKALAKHVYKEIRSL